MSPHKTENSLAVNIGFSNKDAASIAILGHEFDVPDKILIYALGILGVYIGTEGLVDLVAVAKKIGKP